MSAASAIAVRLRSSGICRRRSLRVTSLIFAVVSVYAFEALLSTE